MEGKKSYYASPGGSVAHVFSLDWDLVKTNIIFFTFAYWEWKYSALDQVKLNYQVLLCY